MFVRQIKTEVFVFLPSVWLKRRLKRHKLCVLLNGFTADCVNKWALHLQVAVNNMNNNQKNLQQQIQMCPSVALVPAQHPVLFSRLICWDILQQLCYNENKAFVRFWQTSHLISLLMSEVYTSKMQKDFLVWKNKPWMTVFVVVYDTVKGEHLEHLTYWI